MTEQGTQSHSASPKPLQHTSRLVVTFQHPISAAQARGVRQHQARGVLALGVQHQARRASPKPRGVRLRGGRRLCTLFSHNKKSQGCLVTRLQHTSRLVLTFQHPISPAQAAQLQQGFQECTVGAQRLARAKKTPQEKMLAAFA